MAGDKTFADRYLEKNGLIRRGTGEDFDLEPHLLRLQFTEKFYASLMRRIVKRKCVGPLAEKIPTAAISADGTKLVMYWNPLFFEKQTDAHIQAIFKHELYHLIFGHLVDRMRENRKVWNFATDLAINSLLGEDALPKFCLYPGRALHVDESTKEAWTEEQLKDFEALSAVIEGMDTYQSSEFYYSELMKHSDKISGGIEIVISMGEESGQFDGHEMWDDVSDSLKDVIREKAKAVLRDCVREADSKTNGWGTVSAETQRSIREIISTQVSWKSLLRQFVGFAQRADRYRTRTRRHRKYGIIHPGSKRDHLAKIAIAVDMSGSVCDAALELIYAEIAKLLDIASFVFVPFDHAVAPDDKIKEYRRGEKLLRERVLMGGTCFDAPTNWATDRRDIDGLIIMTDGYAPPPGPCNIKRAWMIVPDCPRPDFMDDLGDLCMMLDWPKDHANYKG